MSSRATASMALNLLLCILSGLQQTQAAEPPHAPPNTAPRKPQERAMDLLPEISVAVLGPINSLKGHDWPMGYDWIREKPNQPLGRIVADSPHQMVIHLPSGRSIRHYSKASVLHQEAGIVIRIHLPPNSGLSSYQEAIELLEQVLKAWDAEPNEGTKQALVKWKAEGDLKPNILAKRGGGADFRGEDKVGISFEIRSDFLEKGWYLSLDVAATLEEERKLWGSSTQPATQPATKPTGNAP